MKLTGKKFVWAVIIVLMIVAFKFTLYDVVLIPAAISSGAACAVDVEEYLNGTGYVIAGTTTAEIEKVNGEDVITDIKVEIFNKDPRVSKHETVHVCQLQRGFPSTSCDHKYQKYFTEVEASTMQYLPNSIFVRTYGKCAVN
jgi:hypothetical protein